MLVQDRCMVCAERTSGMQIILATFDGTPSLFRSKVTYVKWKLVSVHLEIVLTLTQDRCTGCSERTIGSEIILDACDGTPR